jgi:uncharacterized DUF497 family protein
MPEFEYDPRKSEANKARHGIDFVKDQALWADPRRLEIAAHTAQEPRTLVIGEIEGKPWVAVITYRGARVRLISVRRAREKEVALYEGQETAYNPGEGI